MSKPSDSVAGNTKKIVGEVQGDGKLGEEDKRQKRGTDSDPDPSGKKIPRAAAVLSASTS